jgi:hypothetical protein
VCLFYIDRTYRVSVNANLGIDPETAESGRQQVVTPQNVRGQMKLHARLGRRLSAGTRTGSRKFKLARTLFAAGAGQAINNHRQSVASSVLAPDHNALSCLASGPRRNYRQNVARRPMPGLLCGKAQAAVRLVNRAGRAGIADTLDRRVISSLASPGRPLAPRSPSLGPCSRPAPMRRPCGDVRKRPACRTA